MHRRDFLSVTLSAGAATLAGGRGAAAATGRQPESGEPATAAEPGAPAGGASAPTPWSVPAFEHAEATVAGLQRAQADGSATARALAEAYLARMDAVDIAGPRLGSVLERNPDALAIADALDRERREKGPRGPLHGIPVLIKDNIDTADRMRTSAGSLALAESIAPRDAFVVERLRAAGAVILGKTNLSEWANFRSTRSTSGWSGRGGQTRNPYAVDRNPSGSSSGSGAATSANLCAVAIGTETDGSIVSPANACGVVGVKPTVGLVSRSGIIPISATQDTAGPMARTVADAAALLTVIVGIDPNDPATERGKGRAVDYTSALDAGALKGARLGVVRKMFGRNEHVARVMEEALAAMKALGAEIVDPVEIESQGKVGDAEFQVLLYEFKDGLNRYLASLGPSAPHKTLADLIAFNDTNRDREMPYFAQEIFVQAQEKGPLTTKEYVDALETCRRLSTAEGIDAALTRHTLDALVAPTDDPAFLIDLVNGDHYTGTGSSTLPAVSGYPHITVPAGRVFGLPVGLSFFGAAWSEARLLALAYAFEQATRHRAEPRLLPTAFVPS